MNRRFLIPFLSCIGGLIGSEYFLLVELFNERRIAMLAGSSVVMLCSILLFWRQYRIYRKSATAAG